MTSTTEGFGRLLRAYREGRGLSINQLGRRAGCDPSYVSKLESGHRRPPREVMLRRLCLALRLDGAEQNRLALAATGLPEAWDWAQAEIHAATMRAANALIGACPCAACEDRRAEATA